MSIQTIDVPARLASIWASLDKKDTASLRTELTRVLGITAENLCRAAIIIGILERRGEDLSGLKLGLLHYLRKIAGGQVLPEAVARFIGHPALKKIACLPLADQQKCVATYTVAIGVFERGVVDQCVKPILQLEPNEVSLVFAADHIRTPEEQVALIRSKARADRRGDAEMETVPFSIVGNACVVSRPVRLTKRDLENILRAMQ